MGEGRCLRREEVRTAIVEGGLDQLDRITAIIETTGALEYTAMRAREAADTAIEALADIPDSDYKQALISVAEFSVERRS